MEIQPNRTFCEDALVNSLQSTVLDTKLLSLQIKDDLEQERRSVAPAIFTSSVVIPWRRHNEERKEREVKDKHGNVSSTTAIQTLSSTTAQIKRKASFTFYVINKHLLQNKLVQTD